MKVVITTPTGNVGSRLVRLLLQAGVRPTLLLRDPDRLDAETRELVDTVQGDQLDAEDVLRATEGADALYSVDPPVDDEDPIATYARAGSHAARAIQEHAIARTLFQSSVGAENATARGRSTGSPVRRSRACVPGAPRPRPRRAPDRRPPPRPAG